MLRINSTSLRLKGVHMTYKSRKKCKNETFLYCPCIIYIMHAKHH